MQIEKPVKRVQRTVRLPEEDVKKLQRIAIVNKVSLNRVIEHIIADYFAEEI